MTAARTMACNPNASPKCSNCMPSSLLGTSFEQVSMNRTPEKMNEIRNMTTQEEIGSIADIFKIYTIDEIFEMEIPIST